MIGDECMKAVQDANSVLFAQSCFHMYIATYNPTEYCMAFDIQWCS